MITDEILNKYIDGELSPEEIGALQEELNRSPELFKKLKALKLTDAALQKLEVTSTSENFTASVMAKVKFKSKIRESVSPVFIAVISFFCVLVIGIFGFIIQMTATTPADENSKKIVENVDQKVSPYLDKFSELITNDSVLFISGMIAFVLLLGFYFMVHSHKSFKQSLERF